MLRVIFKFRFTFPFDMFPNIDRMKNINCPVLVIHSIKDEVVPIYHGEKLYEASKYKFEPFFVDWTNHNNVDRRNADVFKQMNNFLYSIDQAYNVKLQKVNISK